MSWRGTGCFDWRNVHYTHITRKSKVFRNYATTYTIILPTTHQNRILGHVTQNLHMGGGVVPTTILNLLCVEMSCVKVEF